jgi:cytoskeletal protein CcmA (bactofilin family)
MLAADGNIKTDSLVISERGDFEGNFEEPAVTLR